ncbi:nucleotide sugar dehydrogenase [Acidobacteria bacterium AH-259-D05]|nr:nucleotide sugar dehydrogenase [Acidobacteria bacterium AH-259-D05]
MDLKEKIVTHKAKIGLVGLGYAGLPLAMEFAGSGLMVHGIDVDSEKVRDLNQGKSHVQDVKEKVLQRAIDSGNFKAHADYPVVSQVDCVIICVPTPLRQTKDPDISYIIDAAENIRKYLHKDMLVVLQSTTYPGTTDEVLTVEFQSDHFHIGKDLFLGFSPERIDPGNPTFNTKNIPKIVGGVTPQCTQMARILYEQVIDEVISVSSAATAEMVKLLENTFRAVNIGLVNEITIMCDKLGVSVWEVIEAAATKPFGFMPFFPGPGLGGHCIPIDPLYLSWKLKMLNYNARFIELASEVNTQMPEYCVHRIVDVLNHNRKCVNGTRILMLGLTYKRDVSDVRESPALDIIRLLEGGGAKVDYSDPYVPELHIDGTDKESVPVSRKTIQQYELVVMVTDHSCFDYDMIQESAQLIFDTRNVFQKPSDNLVKL